MSLTLLQIFPEQDNHKTNKKLKNLWQINRITSYQVNRKHVKDEKILKVIASFRIFLKIFNILSREH